MASPCTNTACIPLLGPNAAIAVRRDHVVVSPVRLPVTVANVKTRSAASSPLGRCTGVAPMVKLPLTFTEISGGSCIAAGLVTLNWNT